ncbi:MAG TPA: peptidoglycan recognition family protein [Luteimonas sp.]|nr:peptidoglycan recognition family protein [Luteimonas sp.]
MAIHSRVVLAAVIGAVVATAATAATGASERQAVATVDRDGEAVLAGILAAEERALRPQRQAFQHYFREAYARYPSIPLGTLEAIAYVQSRWLHLQVKPGTMQGEVHHRMPAAHGVMGLYAGEGFADQVGDGARLLRVDAARVRTDARSNVLAAAALLDREIRLLGGASTPEATRPALMRYAGFSPSPAEAAHAGAIGDYARTSFAYDVLLAQDRGVDDRGIVVPQRAIAWEQAFAIEQLVKLRAPFVRLDVANDRISTDRYEIDPLSETLRAKPAPDGRGKGDLGIQSTDYGPAIWNAASASNYTASRSAAVSAVTLHTAQGSYAGTISWFKNASAQVSAHYVIRSSDGQVTQMVRNAHTAWHVRSQNSYTLGIEHEGYVDNSSWYTASMYDASAALVRSVCATYAAIDCATAYSGAPGSGINVLPTSVDIKGHQHFSGQTHTDPGINWNWAGYYTRLNPGSGGITRVLDSFESSVGHFDTSPAYSGSTAGISAGSTATRDCALRRNGSCSLRVLLKDDTSSSAAWAVRLLSGSGLPGSNTALTRANGAVGFWVYAGGSGMSVAVGIDDSDGTERSVARALPANAWTFVSWSLTDAAQWNPWVDGDGAISAASVKLDAVWLYRAQTAYDVNAYLDDVQASD